MPCGNGEGLVGDSVKIVNDKHSLTLCEVKAYGEDKPFVGKRQAVVSLTI